jgi:hypothetical protein
MRDKKLKLEDLKSSHTLGKGIPNERDEDMRREVCECEG